MDGPPNREYLCFVPTPLHELTWSCGICVCVWAVEAVLRRLLFHFKYMPTREVMKQRLGAEHHEESSTVMQGTMIWCLINTVVRFCQISVVF
jgi:hypothetical protein